MRPGQVHIAAILGLLLLLPWAGRAQLDTTWAEWVERPVPVGTQRVALDSFPPVMATIQFRDTAGHLRQPAFHLAGTGPWFLVLDSAASRPLHLRYRRVPLAVRPSYQNKDTSRLLPRLPDEERLRAAQYSDAQTRRQGFEPFAGLSSQGSISRGVTVGSNQDAVLNSALNLQLTGQITAGTQLRASITDEQLPVQTGGYTQQLREFDRVYLELENPDFGLLRAGDYTLASDSAYFLGFAKRVSGAGIETVLNKAGTGQLPLRLHGGLARGKFARNRFQGEEGNQGPYKLRGNEGENFIVIISGSERVYINGELQQRGQQNDYVMDYNAGEITFTALQPITRNMRITVEFQYTQRNFLRTVAYGQTGWEGAQWETQVDYYTEQDHPSQPLAEEYSDTEKQRLAQAGDDLDQAQINTAQPASYNEGGLFYRLTDSLGYDSVLVYTPDSSGNLYTAGFTFVGEGRGNYELARSDANGRVYRWVAPANGQPQGSYAPVRQLIAPRRLEVLNLSTQGKLAPGHQLRADWAVSRQDLNRFSDRDQNNDLGMAGKLGYQGDWKLGKGRLISRANYEFNQARYATVERIRSLEFARQWSLPLRYQGDVALGGASLTYQADSLRGGYRAEWLAAGPTEGQRHKLQFRRQGERSQLALRTAYLRSRDSLRSTHFWRERGRYDWRWGAQAWSFISTLGEYNAERSRQGDSLLRTSFRFWQYGAGLGYGDSTANFGELSYRQRWEDTVRQGSWRSFSREQTLRLRGQWAHGANGRLQGQVNWRQVALPQQNGPAIQTITSRLNYQQRLWREVVVSQTLYETGSGREPRRVFSYLKVPSGTGTYTFTDYNGNGEQELDEFEVAPAPDLANYIRVFTPTDTYVRTSQVKLGENLRVQAPQAWRQKEDWRRLVSRFSTVSSYRLERKVRQSGARNSLNPFEKPAADSLIVGLTNNFRHTLFFNRSQVLFGGDYTYRRTDNRNLLSFGVERQLKEEQELNLRYRFQKDLIFRVGAAGGERRNASGNFARRNYTIQAYRNRYALSYQPGEALVLTGSYQVRSEESKAEQNNLLVSHDATLEFQLNRSDKLALRSEVSYVFNGFAGPQNTPAAFSMLQALQPGDNLQAQLTFQRTFLENVVVSLTYRGRFSGGVPAVHTGQVEVKAFL
ncbi:MAG: hypothetical protein RI565_00070 [Schleiferiaceae bacterium]|nr:hypothetical protein [Schleiferiaceae bacterium]